ncbi:TPA: hypothetical protein LSW83_003591 [Serratia marcescens]|nr:hypothetical protein [Serratia marcescens]
MSPEKLSELSKPVAWLAIYHGDVYDEAISITRSVVEAQADRFGWESALTEITPLYSQEYVSALLAELEAKDKRIAELEDQLQSGFTPEALAQEERAENAEQRVAELEAKMATPVRLPDTRQSVSGDRYQWSDGVFNYKQDAIALLREQGFIIEGGE